MTQRSELKQKWRCSAVTTAYAEFKLFLEHVLNRSRRMEKVSGQKTYLLIPLKPSQKAPAPYLHRVLSWRFGSENWLCHSCHFKPQQSIVKEHGGVNCPYSVPGNQREYLVAQTHAAHIHYLCPAGEACPDFFIKRAARHSDHVVLKIYFAWFSTETNPVGLIKSAFCLYC